MARPSKQRPALDPLTEIRAMRARQAALKDDLRAKRERLVAEIAEIDLALREIGEPTALPPAPFKDVEGLIDPIAHKTIETIRKKPALAAAPEERKGLRLRPDGTDPVAEQLTELLPWLDVLKNDRQRQTIRLRAAGVAPAAIAAKVGCSTGDVSNDLARGRRQLSSARAQGAKPAEKPTSDDDEGEPAPAPAVDWGLLGADGTGYVGPAAALEPPTASKQELKEEQAPPNPPAPKPPGGLPAGWNRSDPAEDFTDVESMPPKADPGFVHLWSPESGGTPACTLHHDAQARLVTDKAEVTCSVCFAIADAPARPRGEPRPPEWVLGWLSPELRRAYQGVVLEGLSCATIAWNEDTSAAIISGRVVGARGRIRRLLYTEAARAAAGHPMTDAERAPPPAYAKTRDPLLAILRSDREIESPAADAPATDDEDAEPPAVAIERARRHLTARADGGVRAKTLSGDHLRRDERRAGEELEYPADVDRPRTRGACKQMQRPCPFVSCKHHLYLDVNPATGSIKLNFPHLEVWEMAETCSLDVADRGGVTLDAVGAILNLTRERIRQVEVKGMDEIKRSKIELDVMPERHLSALGGA